jgi:hypothetical protein
MKSVKILNKKIIYILLLIVITPILFNILEAKIISNYGYQKSQNIQKIYLTIDMCPSRSKDYDKDLFDAIVMLSKRYQKPINVAIAVSGYWILEHKEALEEIKQLEKEGYMAITWVNHGYQHHYDEHAKLQDNFMLHNEKYAIYDIIKNHSVMIEYGLTPSNFFRFPGLISDEYLNNLLTKIDLIPLGASTWLAKSRGKFSGGDIILLHGNTNERLGAKLFIKNVKNNAFDNFEFASISDFTLMADTNENVNINSNINSNVNFSSPANLNNLK